MCHSSGEASNEWWTRNTTRDASGVWYVYSIITYSRYDQQGHASQVWMSTVVVVDSWCHYNPPHNYNLHQSFVMISGITGGGERWESPSCFTRVTYWILLGCSVVIPRPSLTSNIASITWRHNVEIGYVGAATIVDIISFPEPLPREGLRDLSSSYTPRNQISPSAIHFSRKPEGVGGKCSRCLAEGGRRGQ